MFKICTDKDLTWAFLFIKMSSHNISVLKRDSAQAMYYFLQLLQYQEVNYFPVKFPLIKTSLSHSVHFNLEVTNPM